MSANTSESNASGSSMPKISAVPKKITNAQTVCNERSEKGKLCNGHLKQLNTGGEDARVHLRGDDVLFKCNICGTLYMGPPLGHLRDPGKMNRFVERELTALLQAAGGTLPAFAKNESGSLVQVNPPLGHGHAAPAAKAAPPAAVPAAEETVEQKRARKLAESAAKKVSAAPIPGAAGPPPGETPEQKLARLKAVVAEAKRRKEAAGEGGEAGSPVSSAGERPLSAVEQSPSAAPGPAIQAATPALQTKTIPTGPIPGETPEQKVARLKAVVEEAKRRKEAGETAPAKSPASVTKAKADGPTVTSPVAETAPVIAAVQPSAEERKAVAAPSGPVPGETKEQKLARLQAVVAEAKRRKEEGETAPANAQVAAAKAESSQPVTASPTGEIADADAPVATPAPPAMVEQKAAAPSGPVPGETKEQKIARLQA
ncbi:MAG: hypothetical protein QOH96_2234, partial [Blastocatellia bacterium]|nr:hypothetical protein [Blastocatellia bacterium]